MVIVLDFDDKNVLKYKKWLKFEKLKIDENELGQIASKHTTVVIRPIKEYKASHHF